MHLKSITQISNLRSLTKAPLFPVKDGQTVLAKPTQRWAALLLLIKSSSHTQNKNNVVLNFETKEHRKLLLCAFKLILTNIRSEIIDKNGVISTQDGQTVFAQPTQGWAALPLSMKK